jgi:hypothetical protein
LKKEAANAIPMKQRNDATRSARGNDFQWTAAAMKF